MALTPRYIPMVKVKSKSFSKLFLLPTLRNKNTSKTNLKSCRVSTIKTSWRVLDIAKMLSFRVITLISSLKNPQRTVSSFLSMPLKAVSSTIFENKTLISVPKDALSKVLFRDSPIFILKESRIVILNCKTFLFLYRMENRISKSVTSALLHVSFKTEK